MAPCLPPMSSNLRSVSNTSKRDRHQCKNICINFKIIVDQLATCGAPMSEDDLIIHTVSGLPFVYRPFHTSICTRSRHDPVSLEELHTLLVCEELSLADDINAESSTAFAASKSSFPQGRPTTT
ncbi:hypothetical protein MRB53_000850 [Persea americana]|uniref:Uncharacterized protein n=1 Tax=Persea americana TaxID=3435 RepID=A0ACC2MQ05_PERAE|nr:hypothetical protein MRB53_000850 [Persea americana]